MGRVCKCCGVGMTDRELLEQAHDALYKEDRISGYANYGKLRKDLRERLAQPEPMQRFTDVQQEIEAALTPEQDPVAYVFCILSSKSISDEIAPTGWSTFESKIEKLRADPWVQNGIAEIVPLYTSPQQREWQGLTDEEIQTTWDSVMDGAVSTRREVYKTIEAKLKEKNT